MLELHGKAAAALYAVVASAWAWAATASPACIVPTSIIPGGKPTTAVPGLTPRFPLIWVTPVLVTVEAPRTAKVSAVPRVTPPKAGATNVTTNNDNNTTLFIILSSKVREVTFRNL